MPSKYANVNMSLAARMCQRCDSVPWCWAWSVSSWLWWPPCGGLPPGVERMSQRMSQPEKLWETLEIEELGCVVIFEMVKPCQTCQLSAKRWRKLKILKVRMGLTHFKAPWWSEFGDHQWSLCHFWDSRQKYPNVQHDPTWSNWCRWRKSAPLDAFENRALRV